MNVVHLGAKAFDEISGEVVQTAAFVMMNNDVKDYVGTYCRLTQYGSEKEKESHFSDRYYYFYSKKERFEFLPGQSFGYWLDENTFRVFREYESLDSFGRLCLGMRTGDNDRFLRRWYEVDFNKVGLAGMVVSSAKWYPYNKGGEYRKWYGNLEYVVNWENNGYEIKENTKKVYPQLGDNLGWKISNEDKYFTAGIAWSRISSFNFGVRYCSDNMIFDTAAPMMFPNDEKSIYYILGFMCTKIATQYLQLINPTIAFQVGDVAKLPLVECTDNIMLQEIDGLVKENIEISKADWDSSETSWDYVTHPYIMLSDKKKTMQEISEEWNAILKNRFQKVKENEQRLNNLFCKIYSVSEEDEVRESDITLRVADVGSTIKEYMSFVIGCMFGRYGTDKKGLVYAGGDYDKTAYIDYLPDEDNIIPLTDEEYFEENIVSKFIDITKIFFGEQNIESNLDFIASNLDAKGTTSREIIRNYYLKNFISDHNKLYQKRPIYWLFDSGKQNGFKALIYMHRYNADTIGNLRVDYLHRMERIYESEINRMQDTIDNSSNAREVTTASKRKEKLQKQLKECQEYDEKIGHLALSRIEIDLDDGVKVNYEKVQTANDGKKYQVLAKV